MKPQESIAAAVAAVPPVVLLAITHLTVILTRPAPGTAGPEAAVSDPTASSPAVLDAPSTSQPRELTTPRTAGEPAHRAGRNVPDTSTSAPALERRDRAADLRGAGWSNKRIARELGVHPSTVGRWFARAHLPDTSTPEMTDGEEATR